MSCDSPGNIFTMSGQKYMFMIDLLILSSRPRGHQNVPKVKNYADTKTKIEKVL